MTIVGAIVNSNKVLIGFVMKGTANQFGELGNSSVITRNVPLKYLMKSNFSNKQIGMVNGKFFERGDFKLCDLPLYMLNEKNEMVKIPNGIELTSRYVKDNVNIGFGVRFGTGETGKYSYSNVIKLSEVFKAVNFMVKVNSAGKMFIAGKAHCPLASLPEITIGKAPSKKRTRSNAKPVQAMGEAMQSTIDILDIFNFVRSKNGFIINFSGTKYSPTGNTVTKIPEKFTPFNIGELASPYLDFHNSMFNASCKFKVPGTIALESTDGPSFAGDGQSLIYTYIFRSKNIFYDGEVKLHKIGLIIPAKDADELVDKFGSALAIQEVTDRNILAVVSRLINWKDSKIFEADVSKVDLLNKTKFGKAILKGKTLYNAVYAKCVSELQMKYIRGVLKDAGTSIKETEGEHKEIAPQFRGKSKEELERISAAGVNIYTGAFTTFGENARNSSAPSSDTIQEMYYAIDEVNPSRFTYKKLCDGKGVPEELNTWMKSISSAEDALREEPKIMERLNKAKRALWMHKTAMWLQSNKLYVHANDAAEWEIDPKARTKATCYVCKNPEAKGLKVYLTNLSIPSHK